MFNFREKMLFAKRNYFFVFIISFFIYFIASSYFSDRVGKKIQSYVKNGSDPLPNELVGRNDSNAYNFRFIWLPYKANKQIDCIKLFNRFVVFYENLFYRTLLE